MIDSTLDLFKCANALDELGYVKEADSIDRMASNQFMLTKKKKNPLMQITNKIDALSGQVAGLMNSKNDSGGGEEKTEIQTEPILEQGVEKVKFEINK